MKTDTKHTKPFDLEKALAGEPVKLRNNRKAFVQFADRSLGSPGFMAGYVTTYGGMVASPVVWCMKGRQFHGGAQMDIIGMWVEQLVFNHWDLLQEDIKYLAKDGDGVWYGYRGNPSKEEEGWWDLQRYEGCYSAAALKPSLFPECDWENSLIKRPEK